MYGLVRADGSRTTAARRGSERRDCLRSRRSPRSLRARTHWAAPRRAATTATDATISTRRRTNLTPRYDDKGRTGANGNGPVIPQVEKQASAPPIRLDRIARTDGITWATDASFLSILSASPVTSPHARVQECLLPGANQYAPKRLRTTASGFRPATSERHKTPEAALSGRRSSLPNPCANRVICSEIL